MSFEISGVSALEILDSRGRPTLQNTVTLVDGTTAVAGRLARSWTCTTTFPKPGGLTSTR